MILVWYVELHLAFAHDLSCVNRLHGSGAALLRSGMILWRYMSTRDEWCGRIDLAHKDTRKSQAQI